MPQPTLFYLPRCRLTNTLKPAKVETGVEVKVPLFINEGELIEVDTRDGSYVNRVKA